MDLVYLLGLLVVLIAVTVLPVMLAAKWAHARRHGFFAALGAVVLATIVGQAVLAVLPMPLIGILLAFVVACAAYALVLGTSFVGGVGIAVVAFLLQTVIVIALVALGMQVPFLAPTGVTI